MSTLGRRCRSLFTTDPCRKWCRRLCAEWPITIRETLCSPASRAISDFFVPGPLQEAAVETLHSPGWARHLKLLRTTLRERRDAMVAGVRRQLGEESLTTIPLGGMHLWVRLPDKVDDIALAARLATSKVIVSPGRRWFPAEPTGSYVRLSYAGAPPDLIAQ